MQQEYSPTASTSQPSLSRTNTSTSSFAPSPKRTMSNSSSSTSSTSAQPPPNRSTTSTPVSLAPPRPSVSRGASSAFDFLFGPSGGGPPTQLPRGDQKNGYETSGDASRIDKGKAVAREEDVESEQQRDAIQRQERVDKVLKRAEAAQVSSPSYPQGRLSAS